jgi:hypothetical protein
MSSQDSTQIGPQHIPKWHVGNGLSMGNTIENDINHQYKLILHKTLLELIPYIGGLLLIHENTTHTKLKILAVGGPFSLKPMSCFDILPHVEMNTYFLGVLHNI